VDLGLGCVFRFHRPHPLEIARQQGGEALVQRIGEGRPDGVALESESVSGLGRVDGWTSSIGMGRTA
jgi:hypothetical protein